jgi:16S rRNA (cytosine967-C5)-methyltransferase
MDRSSDSQSGVTARQASYYALLKAFQGENFIQNVLEEWDRAVHPSTADYHFAMELSYGVCRWALTLDYLASQFTSKQKLSLKLKEKIILRQALYQCYFMDKVPSYAAVNEAINLAHEHCHPTFVKFLNAILRKASEAKPEFPTGDSIPELSIRFSFPEPLVALFVADYGKVEAKRIMEASNIVSPLMVRQRGLTPFNDLDVVTPMFPSILRVKDSTLLSSIVQSADYYIQNITPAYLIHLMSEVLKKDSPQTILDLCASPGGKLLAVHDQFPKAKLFANDVSEDKIKKLKENCEKYHLSAELSCMRGEEYPLNRQFNLVILDVPCSNTGVLNKRVEARWRQSQDVHNQLPKTQKALLRRAVELLTKEGKIWYMTCSILKKENEELMEWAAHELDLRIEFQKTILPNVEGWDGGFGAVLTRSAG